MEQLYSRQRGCIHITYRLYHKYIECVDRDRADTKVKPQGNNTKLGAQLNENLRHSQVKEEQLCGDCLVFAGIVFVA